MSSYYSNSCAVCYEPDGSFRVLIVNKDSGQQLRQDDPTALKDIIQIVQTKVGANESSSRYMYIVARVAYSV